MHISFLLPDLRGGGAQKMIINLANWFSAQGHHVELVLICDEGPYKTLIHESVKIVCFHKSRTFAGLIPFIRYIRTEQPDISLSALFHVNIVQLLAKKILGETRTKFIATERNLFSLRTKNSERWKDRILVPVLVKHLYKSADKIVAISNGVAKDLKQVIGVNNQLITTIYNPVVTPEMVKTVEAAESQGSSRKDEKRKPVFIASGRLVEQKDYPTLFRAFALYLENHHGTLVILGEGPLKTKLERLARNLHIENHIEFKGFVANPLSYIRNSDVFILSSAWEGFGNVLVEALLCGKDIVSTNCLSGPAEILQNGRYGQLVPVGDYQQFSRALLHAIKKQTQPDKQKQRALDFTVDKIGAEYYTLFKAL